MFDEKSYSQKMDKTIEIFSKELSDINDKVNSDLEKLK